MASIDGAASFGIALHVVRGDVGGHLCELHGIAIGRIIRGAHATLRADIAGCACELNPRSASFGGRVSSDGVPGQNCGLRSAKERRVIRLRVSLSFLQLHVALEIHLGPATRSKKLRFATIGAGSLRGRGLR